MEFKFKLTRNTDLAGGGLRTSSIAADADKVLKQFEAHNPGARARVLDEADNDEWVTVALSPPDGEDWAAVEASFDKDLKALFLRSEPAL